MDKICPNCGNSLKDKSNFCGKCGTVWKEQTGDIKQKPALKNSGEFIKAYKGVLVGIGALLAAVIIVLVIVNPANSPKAVFDRYLGCMHSQNEEAYREISYDAHFSTSATADDAVTGYKARFTNADAAYKNNGKTDLLKDKKITILKEDTPAQSEIATRRSNLSESYRNTARITDIRNITFEIKQGDNKTTGTAELICVTGKWYIADVTGI